MPVCLSPAIKVVVRPWPCGTAATRRAPDGPAVAARHVGGSSGLSEKHEPRRVHEALPSPPKPALAGDVGPVLLGGS
jgi:hypothetical protein